MIGDLNEKRPLDESGGEKVEVEHVVEGHTEPEPARKAEVELGIGAAPLGRPVNLAQIAPDSFARVCRPPPALAVKPAERRRQPPGPPSPLARNAPAFVWLRAAA